MQSTAIGSPSLAGGGGLENYEVSSKAVHDRLGVNTEHNLPSARDALMEEGLRGLGWHVDSMPRNVIGCTQDDECGYCSMGCRRGAKRSTLRTWLEDAAGGGARIVPEAEATRILVEGGRAVGVAASVGGVPLTVRARAVVLACGSLLTPVLLKRSGIGGSATGRYFRLHPATAVWGRFPDHDVRPWTGTLQARYSDQFVDLDGHGYGFKFETAPVHPLLLSVFCGWTGGRQFKESLLGTVALAEARARWTDPLGSMSDNKGQFSERMRKPRDGRCVGAEIVEAPCGGSGRRHGRRR